MGRLRIQLIMVVMGGRNDAGSGSGEQFLGGDNHPESIGIDRRRGTRMHIWWLRRSVPGTNVTTNSTTYSWTGGGITNTSIQSITNLGETNISLTATHTGLL
ncbi:hypothetical protein QQ056_03330, partial [Oscillatoria laete-virens NRMC-F 0139]|nr:hypothetical protein [Oscillatoria laete-virens NRMC-F 0139]